MPVPTGQFAGAFTLMRYSFQAAQVAASTNAAMKIVATDAASGSHALSAYTIPFNGSIVKIVYSWAAVITAGTFTLTPSINGSAITLASLIATTLNTQSGVLSATAQTPGARFAISSGTFPTLGVTLVTSGTFAPVTNDLNVDVYVMLEQASP